MFFSTNAPSSHRLVRTAYASTEHTEHLLKEPQYAGTVFIKHQREYLGSYTYCVFR